MQKQLDFKHGCFAEARRLLRATQDDREEDCPQALPYTSKLTYLGAVRRFKRR